MKSVKRIVTSSVVALGLTFFAPGHVFAHCDGLDGPVVKAAQQALETRNLSQVLIWVQADDDEDFQAFRRVPTHLPGMLTRDQLMEGYCRRMGVDPFGHYRTAACRGSNRPHGET